MWKESLWMRDLWKQMYSKRRNLSPGALYQKHFATGTQGQWTNAKEERLLEQTNEIIILTNDNFS